MESAIISNYIQIVSIWLEYMFRHHGISTVRNILRFPIPTENTRHHVIYVTPIISEKCLIVATKMCDVFNPVFLNQISQGVDCYSQKVHVISQAVIEVKEFCYHSRTEQDK